VLIFTYIVCMDNWLFGCGDIVTYIACMDNWLFGCGDIVI
jgi:hypothetical protein